MRRRTAPYWVRELDSRTLHALTGRLVREQREHDLTDRQDWLVDRCLDELAFRRASARSGQSVPCTCWLCMPADWWDD